MLGGKKKKSKTKKRTKSGLLKDESKISKQISVAEKKLGNLLEQRKKLLKNNTSDIIKMHEKVKSLAEKTNLLFKQIPEDDLKQATLKVNRKSEIERLQAELNKCKLEQNMK